MEAWREQLRPRLGKGRLRRGWRLARGGWRLVVQERPVRVLALAAGALGVVLLGGWILAVRGVGLSARPGDYLFLGLVELAVSTVAYTFLFAALCAAVDAAVDETRIDARVALEEAGDRFGPLLIWSLLWLGVWVVLYVSAHSVPAGLVAVAWLVWSYLTAFTIPALILETDSAASAIAASLRTVRRCWREAVTGFVRISLFTWLATLPITLAIGSVTSRHPGEVYGGSAQVPLVLLFALNAVVGALGVSAAQSFALLLHREARDDLPAGEPLPPKPRRRRRTIALRAAGAIVAVLLVLFVIGRLTHRREHHASGDGYFRAAYYSRDEGAPIHDGMPIYFRHRLIGKVVEHWHQERYLYVVYHVLPNRWARRMAAERGLAIVLTHPPHLTLEGG